MLVIVAIAPPIAFLAYILRFDRTEPEPLRMILKILLFGALAIIPAALIQLAVLELPLFLSGGITGAALESFLVVAPSEELVKLAVVMIFAFNNRNFNEKFDGLIYTGAAAIGFAMAENIFYVLDLGLTVGIMRAVTSIPGHTFTGVLMGYFVGQAKFSATRAERNSNLFKGFLVAYSLHALYNTFVLSESAAAALMVPLVIFYFIIGIKLLKRGSAESRRHWETGIYQHGSESLPTVPTAFVSPAPDTVPLKRKTRTRQSVRAVIARTIFVCCALFWLLLIIAIFEETGGLQAIFDLVAGGVLISAIPLAVGFIIERSHRRGRAADETSAG